MGLHYPTLKWWDNVRKNPRKLRERRRNEEEVFKMPRGMPRGVFV